jgi:hypothetical protein
VASISTGISDPSAPGARSPTSAQARSLAAARTWRIAFSARGASVASELTSCETTGSNATGPAKPGCARSTAIPAAQQRDGSKPHDAFAAVRAHRMADMARRPILMMPGWRLLGQDKFGYVRGKGTVGQRARQVWTRFHDGCILALRSHTARAGRGSGVATEMAGALYVRLIGIYFKFSDITSSSLEWPSGLRDLVPWGGS